MIPAFLITFREVIEASLIVATILGILAKLGQTKSTRTVATAAATATAFCILFLAGGSLLGIRVRELYLGRTEEFIEGLMMTISAVFITWAVFYLHTYFARYKTRLLSKLRGTVSSGSERALFVLTFTAVFREGFEIVLFLSTVYLSSEPLPILSGFTLGMVAGLLVSFALFSAAIRMPVYAAFRATSALLILFAAGLMARGIHAFGEAGYMPPTGSITLPFIPAKGTIAGDLMKALFGMTRTMDIIQLTVYLSYTAFMFRKTSVPRMVTADEKFTDRVDRSGTG